MSIENTDLAIVLVEIPDKTTLSAPASWDKIIVPPKEIPTTGTIPSGFQTPASVIQIGSPDVVLVFDKTVTIILQGVTGQIAYKLSNQNTWNLISTCTGTYANPTDPAFPKECSISNGVDTKILTYHFTEFAGLTSTPSIPSSPSTSPSTSSGGSSGGHGRTGSGPSSSSSPGILQSPNLPQQEDSPTKMPEWFRLVMFWWAEGKITEEEMNNALNWLIANI